MVNILFLKIYLQFQIPDFLLEVLGEVQKVARAILHFNICIYIDIYIYIYNILNKKQILIFFTTILCTSIKIEGYFYFIVSSIFTFITYNITTKKE